MTDFLHLRTPLPANPGFHDGELAVQRRAGVQAEAARLVGMLAPADLSGGFALFLAERTFLVVTGRDTAGRLWTSPLLGPPGFLQVRSATEVAVHAAFPSGDPLHGLAAGQQVGMTAIEFSTRRRVRLNGTLTAAGDDGLLVEVEQAYGNCPQYIQRRSLVPDASELGEVRRATALSAQDSALIQAADTFFLGTVHPERGADASHRGGGAGFVRTDGETLWWPDLPGNNMFNSLGNIAANPETALLFFDFTAGCTLHLSGTAEIAWGAADRIVRFTPQHLVAGHLLPARQMERPLP
jgi:predicted pyridoxine 5'-phosphate oxidase superfamily flavin-nucleotide-binding protein